MATRDESLGGGPRLDTVRTDFGELKIIFDWMSPKADVRILSTEKIGWVEFDPFGMGIGQGRRLRSSAGGGRILTVVMNDKAHAAITGASTTA